MLKIVLYSDTLGSYVVKPDAIDMDKLDQTIQRSSELADGLMYEYSLDLSFTKGARDFCIRAYRETGGIEAVVTASIYEYDPNAFKWELIGLGKIKFTNREVDTERFKTSIEQTGFERKVINLYDIDLDVETQESQGGIDIGQTPTITLTLHPKSILKETTTTTTDSNEFAQIDVFKFDFDNGDGNVYKYGLVYGQIDNGDAKFTELEQSFTIPYGYTLLEDIKQRRYVPIALPYPKGASVTGDDPDGTIYTSLIDDNLEPFTNTAAWAEGINAYLAYNTEAVAKRNPIHIANDAGVIKGKLKIRSKHSVYSRNDGGDVDICGEGDLGNVLIKAWFEHRRENGDPVSITQIGSDWSSPGCGDSERHTEYETKELILSGIDCQKGDRFYIYYTCSVYGVYESPPLIGSDGQVWHEFRTQTDKANTQLQLINETVFPATESKAILIYEFLNKICDYCTDQKNSLYSEFFGRTDTDPAYDVDGPGSLLTVTNGKSIRQMDVQTIFANLQDAFTSLRGIHAIGIGFEMRNGKQVVRIEPIEHFYNKNLLILDLGVVSKLKEKEAIKYYYNQVEVGFPKLDIQQTNGIDEFATTRKFKNALTQVSSKLPITSKYKASGYEIESQRRLIGTTKDSKLDDANFFINVRRDGSGFITDRNQDYTSVQNLYDAQSAYNLDFAPARILRAWGKVLASCVSLITNKLLVFSSGDGNYSMKSKKTTELVTIEEDGYYDLTGVEPIWEPEIHTFEVELTRDQMRIIRQNPYGYFRYRASENAPVREGFLLKVSRDAGKNLGTFETLKVFRNG